MNRKKGWDGKKERRGRNTKCEKNEGVRKRKGWDEGRAGTRMGCERESVGRKERVGRRKKWIDGR